MRKTTIAIVSVGVLAVAAVIAAKVLAPKYTVTIPKYAETGELVQLDQGWNDDQRMIFHHTAQGTKLVPYAWFKVLEQPCFSLTGCEEFRNPRYLSRFGFLDSKADPKHNPDGLPVGFSRQENFYDPVIAKSYPALGLTCAACHTGQLHYGKYAVRVDGAPAMIDVTKFQKALGLAMGFTQLIPFRYGRFERNVLGPNATAEQKAELKTTFDAFMEVAKKEVKAAEERDIYVNQAGFARTDALTRIGNQVFAVDMKNEANLAQSNAPVRFPQIWDASWFTWVQYNSSIASPMARNIGEALGVRAIAKLYGPTAGEFENSVDVDGLWKVERLLSGAAPYEGLQSPKWPAVFPRLVDDKVAKGKDLYKKNCAGCHLPPVNELIDELKAGSERYWFKNSLGKMFLKVTDVPLEVIGTDPREARDFIGRKADTGSLNKGTVTAAEGLDLITRGISERFYKKAGFSQETRDEWNGFHADGDPAVRAIAAYKARPLNGIWAVAPYLHNGSVPNLYLLLSPKEDRPRKFWVGSKRFVPETVGYEYSEFEGGHEFDSSATGNSNGGHEFRAGPRKDGVIGPLLSPEDRMNIIEYLKSM